MAFKTSAKEAREFKYEVVADHGCLGSRGGYELRLREVSFNGKEAKYDIRTWKTDENGEHMGKGIQLSGEEAEKLCELLCKIRDEEE